MILRIVTKWLYDELHTEFFEVAQVTEDSNFVVGYPAYGSGQTSRTFHKGDIVEWSIEACWPRRADE